MAEFVGGYDIIYAFATPLVWVVFVFALLIAAAVGLLYRISQQITAISKIQK